ncbi:MAG TPA: hypothetical protein VL359_04555 [bacterium]|nr:hypothetical protein [bacterium]
MSARLLLSALAILLAASVLASAPARAATPNGNPPPTFPAAPGNAPPSAAEAVQPAPAAPPLAPAQAGTIPSVYLGLIVGVLILIFGAFVMLLLYKYLKNSQKPTDHALQFFGIALIIIATLFLMSVYGDSSFISGVFGLFGSIAGYLFGRVTSPPAPAAADGQNGAPSAAGGALPPASS